MKKHRNRDYHHGEYEGAQDTTLEYQNQETSIDQTPDQEGSAEAKDQSALSKAQRKKGALADQADENDDDVYAQHDSEEEQDEEGEEEETEDENGDGEDEEETAEADDTAKGGFDIKKIAQKVMDYINGEEASADKETILKYVSVAILAIYGVRKGGLIGGLLLSAATGLVAKYVQESIKNKNQGQEEETEEEGAEQPEASMAPAV